jgi:uncharacterized membrane protein
MDDTYKWLLFFHVLSAFAVVAGAVSITVTTIGLRSAAGDDATPLMRVARIWLRTSDIGATVALVLGIILAIHVDGYGPFDGWIIVAYALWIVAMATSGKLSVTYRKASEAGGASAVAGAQALYLQAGFVVAVALLLIDMIFKPGA